MRRDYPRTIYDELWPRQNSFGHRIIIIPTEPGSKFELYGIKVQDDVRIYNRALSEAEVKELYEFEKPKTQQASTATSTTVVPNSPTGAAAIEAGIRRELTAAGSIEKVRHIDLTHKMITDVSALASLKQLEILWLPFNNLTDISALSGLTQLRRLSLENNPAISKAQIAELQKALPKCKIYSNATK